MINFTPIPVLFSIGSFKVYSFGFMAALAVIIFLFLVLKEAKKRKIDQDKVLGLILFITIGSLIGARLLYILLNPSQFHSFIDYINLWKGGLSGAGTLIFGTLAAILYAKISKTDFWKMMDLIAPYLALAFAIGRIGCFLRGCCFGLPTTMPWGIVYQGESFASQAGLSGALHPTQLYHSIIDFFIFFVLLKLSKKKYRLENNKIESKYAFFNITSSIFFMFILLYSAERFLTDFFRWHPANEYALGFTISQLIYIGIFIVAFLILKIKEKKKY